MEDTALILISSQTGADPVLLYENTFWHMADFNWKTSLCTKITSIKIWKVTILTKGITEYAYHRFPDHPWLVRYCYWGTGY